ncbi:hypothetical protein WJX73_007798 [Symbiochloris irregularis]|uniref:PDZ domain-containing protein n=1 Tax=Symbiochloris irregularis TaxID=706552 RepID=A0AAW1NTW7_9CHLO
MGERLRQPHSPYWAAVFAPTAAHVSSRFPIFRPQTAWLQGLLKAPACAYRPPSAKRPRVSIRSGCPDTEDVVTSRGDANAAGAARLAALGLAALLAVSPVQAYGYPAAESRQQGLSTVEQASRSWETTLKQAFRRLDVVAEQTLTTVSEAAQRLPFEFRLSSASSPSAEDAEQAEQAASRAQARELILEVRDLVLDHYLDARQSGFDKDKWRGMVKEVLSGPLPDAPAAHRAIKKLLVEGVGDPYTRFVTPQQFEGMSVFDVTGIGLNLGSTDDYSRKVGFDRPADQLSPEAIWVLATVKGSAAEKAGVHQGDEVVAIDGQDIQGQSAYQVAALIQSRTQGGESTSSPQTTHVQLKVRNASGDESDIAVTRRVQPYQSPVTHRVVAEGNGEKVGMVRLSAFNARTRAEVADALRDMEAQGAQRYVLDLRNNLGGLFLEGIEVARLFVDGSSTLAVLEGQGRKVPEAVLAGGHALTQAPVTVLINERSASASEILAGALHDNCRAVLVGSRSYGKGLIQSVYQLEDGSALIVTVGKYLTPSRIDLDRTGIVPDFSKLPSAADAQAALNACRQPQAVLATAQA